MSDSLLKVEISESGPCERTINVTVAADSVKSQREKVISEFRKEAKIKGFRPGKAPRKLVASTYADSIREELFQQVISDGFRQALEKEKIAPLSRPLVEKLDLAEDDQLTFQARFDVSPEIKLERYKKFRVEKKVRKLTGEDVERAIQNFREQRAHFIPKTGAADKGDYLLLDFSVLDEEGKSSPDGRRTNQLVMAGHPDELALFSHALVGLGEGLGQRIEIDFPADYPDETLKGRKVVYLVDVKGVRQKSLPELDDHFARQVSHTQDMEGLRKLIRESMEHEIEHNAGHQAEEDLFREIIEANPFEVPGSLVDSTIRQQIENIKREGRQLDEVEAAKIIRPSAEYAVKREYIILEIARKEGITVTDEDVRTRIEKYAAQLGKPLEEIQKDFRSKDALAHLHSLITVDKVVRFLLENNEIEQVDD